MKTLFKILAILLLASCACAQTEVSDVYQRQFQGETERRLLRLERSTTQSVVPIVYGGTGETTASDAINALLPDQTGNSGEYLTTDGSAVSWSVMTSDYSQVFTVSGSPHTVTIPDGVEAVYAYAAGGGGAGCQHFVNTGNYYLGAGGGGAEYIEGLRVNMIAGNDYDITVGAGGTIGTGNSQLSSDRDGNSGSNTTIETEDGTITLTGGAPGIFDTVAYSGSSTGGAGASGISSVGINASGGSGGKTLIIQTSAGGNGDPVGIETGTGGGGGGGSLGRGGTQQAAAGDGATYGGGGAGGYGSGATNYNARPGADGVVMLQYRFNHY